MLERWASDPGDLLAALREIVSGFQIRVPHGLTRRSGLAERGKSKTGQQTERSRKSKQPKSKATSPGTIKAGQPVQILIELPPEGSTEKRISLSIGRPQTGGKGEQKPEDVEHPLLAGEWSEERLKDLMLEAVNQALASTGAVPESIAITVPAGMPADARSSAQKSKGADWLWLRQSSRDVSTQDPAGRREPVIESPGESKSRQDDLPISPLLENLDWLVKNPGSLADDWCFAVYCNAIRCRAETCRDATPESIVPKTLRRQVRAATDALLDSSRAAIGLTSMGGSARQRQKSLAGVRRDIRLLLKLSKENGLYQGNAQRHQGASSPLTLEGLMAFLASPNKDREAATIRSPRDRQRLGLAVQALVSSIAQLGLARDTKSRDEAAGFVQVATAILTETLEAKPRSRRDAAHTDSASSLCSLLKEEAKKSQGWRR